MAAMVAPPSLPLLEIMDQIEAMVAAGPQGKLDEYLPVVDLLLHSQRLMGEGWEGEGERRAAGLLRTALEDLEYEFQDMLHRRSKQAVDKFSPDRLKEIYRHNYLNSSGCNFSLHGGDGGSNGALASSSSSSSSSRLLDGGGGSTEEGVSGRREVRTSHGRERRRRGEGLEEEFELRRQRSLEARPLNHLVLSAASGSSPTGGFGIPPTGSGARGIGSATSSPLAGRARSGSREESRSRGGEGSSSSKRESSSSAGRSSSSKGTGVLWRGSSLDAAGKGHCKQCLDDGIVAPCLMPESVVRWLHLMAKRMVEGGRGGRCAEVYTAVRSDSLRRSLLLLGLHCMMPQNIEAMAWPQLERLSKDWLQNFYCTVAIMTSMERRCSNQVWGTLPEIGAMSCFRLVVGEGQLELQLLQLVNVAKRMLQRKLPEQLFAILDMFQLVEAVMPELQLSFRDSGITSVWVAVSSLPRQLAAAAAAVLEGLRALLEEGVPEVGYMADSGGGGGGGGGGKVARRTGLRALLRMSTPPPESRGGGRTEKVPPGGGIDPITSYVANYIRHYLERSGREAYNVTLTKCFDLLEEEELTRQQEEVSRGNMRQESGRFDPKEAATMESMTGMLVAALHRNLKARSILYGDAAMEDLYLMNNINYLVKAISQWKVLRNTSLHRLRSPSRREGFKDLMVAVGDLRDDRLVQLQAVSFQSAALSTVLAPLNEACNQDAATANVKTEIARLKRFNTAFEELKRRQREWRIPDEELRRRMCAKWATMIKDRYFKMLIQFWDELTTSKFYVHTPESIEALILDSFFIRGEDSC